MRELVLQGKGREAIEAARHLWSRAPSAEADEVLVGAVALRCNELCNQGMLVEALAVLKKTSALSETLSVRLAAVLAPTAVRVGDIATLAPMLLATDPAQQELANAALRAELVDLNTLATCDALPDAFPLRRQAAILHRAFDQVTRGAVDDAALDLREVPRRSPLAAWVPLVRALAAFHRHDDASCRRCLQAIPSDSAPHRLVTPLTELMVGTQICEENRALALRLGGADERVSRSLANLDLAACSRQQFPDRALEAVEVCKHGAPEILDELVSRIVLRGMALDVPPERLVPISGKLRLDATYWRLMARVYEQRPDGWPIAVPAWEQFRKHALHKGLLDTHAQCAVYLHMAELLHEIPAFEAEAARAVLARQAVALDGAYEGQPREIRDVGRQDATLPKGWYFHPRAVFERAAQADPHPEVFERWLAWESNGGEVEPVISAWRAACPRDVKPVILAMQAAEKRKALTRAQKLLDDAAAIDPLHPEVRRARWRFLTAAALGHLKRGKKPHLALKDATHLDALPTIREGARKAFVTTVRWLAHRIRGEESIAAEESEQTARMLGSAWAGWMFRYTVWLHCQLQGSIEKTPPLPEVSSFAPSLAEALALLEDVKIHSRLRWTWSAPLLESVEKCGVTMTSGHLLSLGKAADIAEAYEVAWTVTRIGLCREDALCARFLLLRADLLFEHPQREDECRAAAVTLARQVGDQALLDEVVDEEGGSPLAVLMGFSRPTPTNPLAPEDLRRVLAREAAADFPRPVRGRRKMESWF